MGNSEVAYESPWMKCMYSFTFGGWWIVTASLAPSLRSAAYFADLGQGWLHSWHWSRAWMVCISVHVKPLCWTISAFHIGSYVGVRLLSAEMLPSILVRLYDSAYPKQKWFTTILGCFHSWGGSATGCMGWARKSFESRGPLVLWWLILHALFGCNDWHLNKVTWLPTWVQHPFGAHNSFAIRLRPCGPMMRCTWSHRWCG